MLLHGRPVPVALILLALVALPAFAQQQLPPTSETIDVSIINVDVFVTDKKGNRVHGLTRDDFVIRENGKLQPITNFAEYAPETKRAEETVGAAGTPAEAAPPGVGAAPPSKRTIVIFIDLVPQPSARVREVFSALRDFVHRAVRPGDSATVVAFDVRLVTRQEFTDDTSALSAALARLEGESIGVAHQPANAIRRAMASDQAEAMAIAALGNETRKQVRGEVASTADLERKSSELFDLVEMSRKAAAMTSLMESMSGVDGKKIMVLALHRFGLRAGFDGFTETSNPIVPPDLRVEKLRQSVMRTANANGVTLYPIHPAGMRWTSNTDAEDQRPDILKIDADMDLQRFGADNAILTNQTASFLELAKETGGLMAAGPSDIVDLLPRVVDDLESYYSLAYRATPTGKDARRKVEVTARNRDYEVRSRRAVIEKSDDTQMDDRVAANLYQPLAHSVIPIQVETGAMKKTARKRWTVPVAVRVPIGALTMRTGDARATGSFSVFIGSGGDFGVISDVEHRTHEYAIPLGDLENARRSYFTYNVFIEVDELPDAISIGVRDDVSKEFGLARVPIPGRGGEEKQGGSLE
ncbi:MAG TPA: VWA domain-containing protein [Thermoanaerobaculia bacterium]|nr:VWA domain-containing protein [Thermoanaerobaculia bacterium]